MNIVRLPLILVLNALGLALFFSWYLPPEHGYWFVIDSTLFHFFNHALIKSHAFLLLVAVTNNRVFDGISLLAMGSLFFCYWRKESVTGRRHRVIMGIVMLFCAVIINQLGHLIPESHVSPTLYFTDIYRVSDLLHFPTKDASKDSFPGDHGLMLLIFTGFMWRYFGKKAFGLAVIIFLIFIMPRMMIGAHWFTDIFVGSLSVVLVCLPWVLLTSISDRLIILLDCYLPKRLKTNH